jgi:plastocyanin
MTRAFVLCHILAGAALAGCSSYGDDINQPSGRTLPSNGVSIVAGAQTKGTAAFSPNPVTISLASDSTVIWFNDDDPGGVYGSSGATHDITADDGSFASATLPPGSSFEGTFSAPGTYGYHCALHPTMKGTVTVTP